MSLPRTLLFIAYHFPPSGGAGVQRSVKFARYLPGFGWRPVVVTRPLGESGRWTPTDTSLGGELPADLPVFRVEGPEPAAPLGLHGFLARNLRLPTAPPRWWIRGALAAGLRAAAAHPPDLVLATMDPYESSFVAAALAARLGRPWVADLRDPWALDEMRDFPSALHRRLELRRMRRALQSAAAIAMNTPEAGRALCDAFPELAGRVRVVTNGFDPDDFQVEVAPKRDGLFRIVHTGYLHADIGVDQRRSLRLRRALGGQRVATEFLPRSHFYLLRALERWRQEDPADAATVRLVLVGALSEADRELVRASRVADLVELVGPKSHAESIAALLQADLLFLPMHELPPGERARIVPGKTYEYLASGRPILAAVPDGDARDWLAASGRALLCRPSDADAMLRLARQARRSGPQPASRLPDAALVERFGRRQLTARLAALLDAASGARGEPADSGSRPARAEPQPSAARR